jgi:hypothetical protein
LTRRVPRQAVKAPPVPGVQKPPRQVEKRFRDRLVVAPEKRNRGLYRGQRAVEGTEGLRGNREPYKGQRAVEETEGSREDRGPREDIWP